MTNDTCTNILLLMVIGSMSIAVVLIAVAMVVESLKK